MPHKFALMITCSWNLTNAGLEEHPCVLWVSSTGVWAKVDALGKQSSNDCLVVTDLG